MEKAERVAVVPVDMGWSDVGSWDALHDLAIKDAGNAQHGEVVAIDTERLPDPHERPLVAAVGVKDLIVIATGDAVLIMPRGSSQEVKRAVEALRKDGHVTLDRPSLLKPFAGSRVLSGRRRRGEVNGKRSGLGLMSSRWPAVLWLVRHGESAGNVARDAAHARRAGAHRDHRPRRRRAAVAARRASRRPRSAAGSRDGP